MKEGNVVLTPIPQADGLIKNRPAIILRELPLYRDFLVCGVSSQLDKEVKGFDEVIDVTDEDFKTTGLRITSLVRLGFLAVLPSTQIIGAIGSLSSTRHRRLLKTLSDYLIQAQR
jgi:mRNA interferase MazF